MNPPVVPPNGLVSFSVVTESIETQSAPFVSVKPHPTVDPGAPEITPPSGLNAITADARAPAADAMSITAPVARPFHIPDLCILFLLIALPEERDGLSCGITIAPRIRGAQLELHRYPAGREWPVKHQRQSNGSSRR